MASLQTFAKGTFASAVGLSTISLGLLYYGQNYLIYPSAFPPGSRIDVPTPADYGLPYEDLTLDTSDGIKIKCYLMVQRRALPGETAKEGADVDTAEEDRKYAGFRPTVLMFHGNGGNIGHRVPLARIFYSKMRCNVILVSYRGYGQSEGSPSEQGFMIDSQAALDYVRDDPTLTSTPVICYGQSIGGAVSISLASRNPDSIQGLILENTFLSIPRLIPSAVPLLSPFAWLCHQKWDSATAITKIPRTTPMLFLGGKQDEIVPHEHMQMLWQITTEKYNPDGTDKMATKPIETASTSTGGWFAQALGFGSTPSAPPATTDKPQKPEEEDHVDEEDPDLKEHSSHEIIGDKEVLVSKRTRYRTWKEFEDGKHNDTCIQPGYWATVWDFVDSIVPIPAE